MGKFDEQIEWCRNLRDEEQKALEPLESGTMKHYERRDNGEWIDVTEKLIEEGRNDIDKLDKLIAAYENAKD